MDSKNKAPNNTGSEKQNIIGGIGNTGYPEDGVGPNSGGIAGIGSGYKQEESDLHSDWVASKGHSKFDSSRARPVGQGGRG